MTELIRSAAFRASSAFNCVQGYHHDDEKCDNANANPLWGQELLREPHQTIHIAPPLQASDTACRYQRTTVHLPNEELNYNTISYYFYQDEQRQMKIWKKIRLVYRRRGC